MKTSSVWCKNLALREKASSFSALSRHELMTLGKSLPLRDLSSGVLQVVFKLPWSCRSVVQ